MLLSRKVGTGLPVVTFENGHCEKVSRYNGDIEGSYEDTWYWIVFLAGTDLRCLDIDDDIKVLVDEGGSLRTRY